METCHADRTLRLGQRCISSRYEAVLSQVALNAEDAPGASHVGHRCNLSPEHAGEYKSANAYLAPILGQLRQAEPRVDALRHPGVGVAQELRGDVKVGRAAPFCLPGSFRCFSVETLQSHR
jgi:hypothetical protein